ncbi:Uncharacterised protein [Escherichia coli]|nr:Uncharacterised protein [Escherichia coli]
MPNPMLPVGTLIYNTAITNVQDMTFAGGEPGVAITITGTYYINSEMWDLV